MKNKRESVKYKVTFIIIIGLLCAGCSLTNEKPQQPNIVFIMADDLGYGDLSSYGAKNFQTPACDQLAKEGMLFTDAHSPSAVCSPSRYSVLTGRYSWRSWLKNWVIMENHPLLIDTKRLTMGKMLQKTGYTTGCVGKWHLGWGTEIGTDYSNETKPGPLEVGFDSFYGVPYSHNSSRSLQVYVRDRSIVNLKKGLNYRSKEARKMTQRKMEDTAIDLSHEAVAFIDKNKDKPFFLYYPTTNIHYPLTPNSRFKGTTNAGIYGEFVVEFDWAVGQVLAALDRNGLTENTIVVLTSDNGGRPPGKALELKGFNGHKPNGNWRGTKRQIYEGGHRVPLIVRWPGKIKKSSRTNETVCLTDFFATFAGILNQTLPQNAAEDSYDLSALLLGRDHKKPLREATVHHSMAGQFAIRKGNWKLIEGSGSGDYPKNSKGRIDVKTYRPVRDKNTGKWLKLDYFKLKPDGKFQLYNLQQDPQEKENLSNKYPAKVKELYELLNKYRLQGHSRP